MMAILVPLLAAASVTLLAWVAAAAVVAASRRLRERYVVRSLVDLQDLLLFIDGRALAALGICLGFFSLGAGLLLGGGTLSVLAAGAGLVAPWLAVRRYRLQRIRSFDAQLVDALHGLANALRAGLSLQQGIDVVAKDAPSPMGQELGLVAKELRLGVSLEDALTDLAGRVRSEDLDLTVTSTNIARQAGGNLAEMFETIAGTIRERLRLEGRIAALTSQGRLQGWIVGALPLLLGLGMRALRPDLVDPMLRHPFGFALLGLVVALELVGFWLIRRIVNVDV